MLNDSKVLGVGGEAVRGRIESAITNRRLFGPQHHFFGHGQRRRSASRVMVTAEVSESMVLSFMASTPSAIELSTVFHSEASATGTTAENAIETIL